MTSPAPPSQPDDRRAALENDADRRIDELFADCGARTMAESQPAPPSDPITGSLALRDSELLTVPPSGVLQPLSAERWASASELPRAPRTWERWFFYGSAGLLLGSLALVYRAQTPPAASPAPEPASLSDSEFIAYLQDTLAEIERDERRTRQLAAAKAERERLERELAAAAAAAAPQVAAPQIAAAPVPTPAPPKPTLPPPPPLPVISIPAPPAPPPPPSQTAAKVAPQPPANPPASGLAVVGSMEIAGRSLALIEVNGKVERVSTGDRIPGTSWSVATIAPRELVLRDRSGRERTVPVGGRL